MTVTEGTNDFYIDDVVMDHYTWTYSGLGGTEEEPELIYERPIVLDYNYSAPPTITIDSAENNNSQYKVIFRFKSTSKTVKFKNVISMIPTSAVSHNPWVWEFEKEFNDRIIGTSAVTDTNPENYTIATMQKSIDQWTGGTTTINFSPNNAGKYYHITYYTYGGNSASYVYQIPSASTLSYNTLGGTSISNVTIFSGGVTTVTNDIPKRTGYVFSGWYDNENFEGNKYDANQEITLNSNMVLYAKWVPDYWWSKQYAGLTTTDGQINLNLILKLENRRKNRSSNNNRGNY